MHLQTRQQRHVKPLAVLSVQGSLSGSSMLSAIWTTEKGLLTSCLDVCYTKQQVFNQSPDIASSQWKLLFLNLRSVGPYRSQSDTERPWLPSSQPLGPYEEGLERPQPVLLPLFTQGLGAGWTAPLSTPQYNGKQGSGKIRESRTHTCHSLDLGGSRWYYSKDTKGWKRDEGGWPVSNCSQILKRCKERWQCWRAKTLQ